MAFYFDFQYCRTTPGAHDSKAVKNICIEVKFILRSTLNPGLALTAFRKNSVRNLRYGPRTRLVKGLHACDPVPIVMGLRLGAAGALQLGQVFLPRMGTK